MGVFGVRPIVQECREAAKAKSWILGDRGDFRTGMACAGGGGVGDGGILGEG